MSTQRHLTAEGIRFSISAAGREVARAYLYLMHNDLHDAPFGLLEDVYVDESQRGAGLGTTLVREVIAAAREAETLASFPSQIWEPSACPLCAQGVPLNG